MLEAVSKKKQSSRKSTSNGYLTHYTSSCNGCTDMHGRLLDKIKIDNNQK